MASAQVPVQEPVPERDPALGLVPELVLAP
jgi:hypothetical protein